MKYLSLSTYECSIKSNAIEIGNLNKTSFKPHIKLNRWDGECYLGVGLNTTKEITPLIEGGKISWCDDRLDVNLYPSDNNYEYEIVLKEKPLSNVIELEIEAEGLKFCRQPDVPPKGIDFPENALGSYAVYHSTRGNVHRNKAEAEKYKTGKAFHIYRPKVIDSVNKWIWGVLNISEGKLTITIDRKWLDKAKYPVTIDPTFGYTDEGSGSTSIQNRIKGTDFTCSEAGTGTSITLWLRNYKDHAMNAKCNVYDGTSPIENGATEEKAIQVGNDQEITFDFNSSPTLANQAYRLTTWSFGDGETGDVRIYIDSEDGYTIYQDAQTYNGWPDPANWSVADANYRISISCTYETGGAAFIPPPQVIIF